MQCGGVRSQICMRFFVKYYIDYKGKPKDDESTMLEPSVQN